MKSKVIIIYHDADLDGKCSAAIAAGAYEDATLYGWNHYRDVDWDLINKHDTVIMVDISFPDESHMNYLKENFYFFWIDHHQESIKKHGKISGLQKVGFGACELCWEFFFPHLKLPQGVKYLADYDIFNHTDKHILPFQYGMRYLDIKVDDKQAWKDIFSGGLKFDEALSIGNVCFEFEKTVNLYKVKSSFEVEFQGHKCIALNSTPTSSLVFDSVGGKDYDIQIIFGFSDDIWKVSMYQNNGRVDVGAIATYFGGGGHEGAAGFQCTTDQIMQLGLIT